MTQPTPRQLEVLRLPVRPKVTKLTGHEVAVLQMLWEDLPRKVIADLFGITTGAIDWTVKNIHKKTGAKTQTAMYQWGLRQGHLTADLTRCKACGQLLKSL